MYNRLVMYFTWPAGNPIITGLGPILGHTFEKGGVRSEAVHWQTGPDVDQLMHRSEAINKSSYLNISHRSSCSGSSVTYQSCALMLTNELHFLLFFNFSRPLQSD